MKNASILEMSTKDLKNLKEISPKEYNVLQINSIAKKYKSLRQSSKGITFAMQYLGTHETLMRNFKFSREQAIQIEERYHDLYKKSFEWYKSKVNLALENGYVEVAFGLRIITPWINKLGINLSINPVAKEYRTVCNALGQSWGLLNDRARVEFLSYVDMYGYDRDILPVAAIHDSQYYLIKDDPKLLHWVNTHLVKCVQWQEDEEIYHPDVPLGGILSVFHPTWAEEIEIPNNASYEEVLKIYKEKICQTN